MNTIYIYKMSILCYSIYQYILTKIERPNFTELFTCFYLIPLKKIATFQEIYLLVQVGFFFKN